MHPRKRLKALSMELSTSFFSGNQSSHNIRIKGPLPTFDQTANLSEDSMLNFVDLSEQDRVHYTRSLELIRFTSHDRKPMTKARKKYRFLQWSKAGKKFSGFVARNRHRTA
jgi:hypothetical protein